MIFPQNKRSKVEYKTPNGTYHNFETVSQSLALFVVLRLGGPRAGLVLWEWFLKKLTEVCTGAENV